MKLKKKSGVIGLVSVLAGVSIISVGFASWVISGGKTESVNGNIVVETVSDDRFLIFTGGTSSYAGYNPQVTYDNDGTAIVYGQPSNMPNTSWLKAKNGQTEQLGATATFYVANLLDGDGNVKSSGFSLTATVEGLANKTQIDAAVGASLIKLPAPTTLNGKISVDKNSKFTFEGDDGNGLVYAKVTVDLDFEWGSHFGQTSTNPYTFYSAHNSDDEYTTGVSYSDDALTQLKVIEAIGANATFKVTLTTAAA